jgi:hypothetical protein
VLRSVGSFLHHQCPPLDGVRSQRKGPLVVHSGSLVTPQHTDQSKPGQWYQADKLLEFRKPFGVIQHGWGEEDPEREKLELKPRREVNRHLGVWGPCPFCEKYVPSLMSPLNLTHLQLAEWTGGYLWCHRAGNQGMWGQGAWAGPQRQRGGKLSPGPFYSDPWQSTMLFNGALNASPGISCGSSLRTLQHCVPPPLAANLRQITSHLGFFLCKMGIIYF